LSVNRRTSEHRLTEFIWGLRDNGDVENLLEEVRRALLLEPLNTLYRSEYKKLLSRKAEEFKPK
jgi:hypothetical protein